MTRAWIERSRRPLKRKTELALISARRLAEANAAVEGGERPRRQRSTFRRKGGFTPASPAQRAKVQKQGCRITGEHGGHVHAAHVCDRGLGGCDHEDCVIGLRADWHRLYDMQQLDVLPHLTKEEQAHLVGHVGIVSALEQSTGERWMPVPLRTQPRKGYAVDDDGTLWPRLVDALLEVRHAAVILSGYPCAEAERLVGWQAVHLDRKRTVQARDGDMLPDAPEMLWLSPAVPEPVPSLLDMRDGRAAA